MREQLIQYVELLFAGAPNSTEMKQEILQNTLDRYDDLVSQGKTPEAAYRLAISGIGDIHEILDAEPPEAAVPPYDAAYAASSDSHMDIHRIRRAVAVALYILCPVPLITLGNVGDGAIGASLCLVLVALATVLIMLSKDSEIKSSSARGTPGGIGTPLSRLIWIIGTILYLLISFATSAWFITWLIFPIIGCVQGLVQACMDLKEAWEYEN